MEFEQLERLHHIAEGSAFQRRLDGPRIVDSGYIDQGQILIALTGRFQQIQARQTRHVDVGDDQIETVVRQKRYGRLARLDRLTQVTHPLDNPTEQNHHRAIIIHSEHARRSGRGWVVRRARSLPRYRQLLPQS